MVGNAHYTLFFEKSNISVGIQESEYLLVAIIFQKSVFCAIIKNNLKNLIIMYPEFLHISPR
jgi:hypothetical protein